MRHLLIHDLTGKGHIIFNYLFLFIQETGAPLYGDRTGTADVDHMDTAYRIIADHTRMATVCISDGLLPGRDKLEYVLRWLFFSIFILVQKAYSYYSFVTITLKGIMPAKMTFKFLKNTLPVMITQYLINFGISLSIKFDSVIKLL